MLGRLSPVATSGYKDSVLHRTLAEAFHRSGLKQQELADRLEVKQQTVSGWVNGTARPATERFPEIEQVLGLDEGTLYATLTQTVQPSSVSVSSRVPDPSVQADNGMPEGVRFFSELDGWDQLTEDQQADIILGAQRATRGAATEGKDR